MQQRFNLETSLPEALKAMYNFSGTVNNTDLTPTQIHLIKIRASQINSCAFCIDMHTKEALKSGETQQRIFLLSAWRETDRFTEEEKALLALVEEITLIHRHGVSEETYQRAKKFFSEKVISQILMATVVINSWNRIAVTSVLPIPQ